MDQIPQIDNGKNPRAPLNAVNIPVFPSSTPFGNLTLKSMKIVQRIDWVNLEIEHAYNSYVLPHEQDINNSKQDILEHQFYIEQIIYWLRKTADEIISLAYIVDAWKVEDKWPSAINIDSIAGLDKNPSQNLSQLFGPHKPFLESLNEVSNAYKHSFINADLNLVGSEYPVVFSLSLKQNKLSSNPAFSSLSFRDVINKFSKFYKSTLNTLQKWSKESATKNIKDT